MKRVLLLLIIMPVLFSCKKEKTDYTETDRKIIQDYIASHNITNAKSTASGLYYVIDKEGSSNYPSSSSTVTISYTGTLSDGSVFDHTADGYPATISLNSVIEGWREGIPFFGRGGKGMLLIPSALGYGNNENSGIPANSVLIFKIELIDFY
jgi:FKBP-type peptidyl-prolyl cis-trans isomerase FkpA